VGVLYGRYELLDRLRAYKVRPAKNQSPHKFETGTQNHEGIAGVLAAVEYLADLGSRYGAVYAAQFPGFTGRRLMLKQAMTAVKAYEADLFAHFVEGLLAIPGLSFYGIRDPQQFAHRTPTAAFRLSNRHPDEVAAHLGQRGVYVWSGNFYAVAVTERLGLEDKGGVVRAGLAHYNTREEVDYCLAGRVDRRAIIITRQALRKCLARHAVFPRSTRCAVDRRGYRPDFRRLSSLQSIWQLAASVFPPSCQGLM